jgi:hypothetical protein
VVEKCDFRIAAAIEYDEELITASNVAVDLVNAGKLEEAEAAATISSCAFPRSKTAEAISASYTRTGVRKSKQSTTARRSRSFASTPATIRRSQAYSSCSLTSSMPRLLTDHSATASSIGAQSTDKPLKRTDKAIVLIATSHLQRTRRLQAVGINAP